MSEYISSEELQRHNASVFANGKAQSETPVASDADRVKKVLDVYINKHKSTDTVRSMAKEANRTAEAQLDLSADLVEILEKIKRELR